MDSENPNFEFIKIPKILLSCKYEDLSLEACVLYSFILDKHNSKKENVLIDSNGNKYICAPRDTLTNVLKCGLFKIRKAFNELSNSGLIYIVRQGLCLPNKIYIENPNHEICTNTKLVLWRKSVLKADDYTCKECGLKDPTGKMLNAHHIQPRRDFPNLTFDLCNGITLCGSCHHNTYKKEHMFFEKYQYFVKKRN